MAQEHRTAPATLLASLLAEPADRGNPGVRPPPGHYAGRTPQDELLSRLLAESLPARSPLRPALMTQVPPTRARRAQAQEDRFNQYLLRGAQVIGLVAALSCTYWLANGPVYDWLFAPEPQPKIARVAPSVVGSPVPLGVSVAQARQPAGATALPSRPPATHAATANPVAAGAATPTPPLQPPTQQPTVDVAATTLAIEQQQVVAQPEITGPVWLTIPQIDMDTPVIPAAFLEDTWETVDYAAGHLFGTGYPGEIGNMVLSGHAGLRGGVFARIGMLRAGDEIFVETNEARFLYRVRESRVVWPTDTSVIDPVPEPILTLLTCTNWDTQRLVVIADLVGAWYF